MDLKWKDRWINPKAEPRPSKIHGMGVFAKETIKKGEVIEVLGGVIVPHSEYKEYEKIMGTLGGRISDEFWMCPPSKDVYKTGVINHSCEPNIGFRSTVELVAIKEIAADQEVLCDYGFYSTEITICACGSKNCRGKVTPEDWKLKSLQDKYLEYFSPYLKEKIKAARVTKPG